MRRAQDAHPVPQLDDDVGPPRLPRRQLQDLHDRHHEPRPQAGPLAQPYMALI